MMKTRLAVVALTIAGLASPAFATGTSYKHSRHHASMTSNKKSGMTTGANMKSKSGTKGSSDSYGNSNGSEPGK